MTTFRLALRGMRSALGRLILTMIAIVAGVSFVSGSFILADSLTSTFDALFTGATDGVDAAVQLDELEFGTTERTIPESLVDELAALPEVGEATGRVEFGSNDSVAPFVLLDEDGERIENNGPPILTFSWDGGTNDLLSIAEGEPPVGEDQVAIDSTYAEQAGVGVGDVVQMATPDGEQTFTIATIVEFEITAGAKFVLFDFPTAQVLYGKEGQVDAIELTRSAGTSPEELVAAAETVVPEGVVVLDQTELTEASSAEFEQIIGILRNALLGFAGVALFVSLFIIYNTFSILVSQRLQQIGMLRAIGATRSQIRQMVLIEAVLVGLVSSLVGLAAGYAIASGIQALASAGGVLPTTDTVVALRTVIVTFDVGIGATVASATIPSLRAGRVTPIAAMRNEPASHQTRTLWTVIGAVILGLGLLLLAVGLFVPDQRVAAVLTELAVGAVFTFVGVAMLGGLYAGPVVQVIGRPMVLGASLLVLGLALPVLTFTVGDGAPDGPVAGVSFVLRMAISAVAALTGLSIVASTARGGRPVGIGGSAAGLEGRLGRQNASRAPQRTAATAATLMIGIALISAVSVVGESLKSSFLGALDTSVHADLLIQSEQGSPIPSGIGEDVAGIDGVDQVGRFQFNQVKVGDEVVSITAYNTETGAAIVDLGVTEGSTVDLPDDGVLVHRDEADIRGLGLGDTVSITFPTLETVDLTVAGIFEDNSVIGTPWVIDTALYSANVDDDSDFFVGVTVADGADFEAVKADVVAVTDSYGGAVAKDTDEYTADIEDQVDGFISLINYLLAFTLVIVFIGVINTIVLSVIERTREIGLLRAVGMTRPQTRASIRWESVIVCLFGADVGIVLGVLFAWAAVAAIPDSVIGTIAIPFETIMFAILAAALAGVIAALLPARRAAKLNVLDAIATGGG